MTTNKLFKNKVIFFTGLMIFIIFIIYILFYNKNYHKIKNMPKIIDGTLDLNGYDFLNKQGIPLDGKWELYCDKWLVTDEIKNIEPDLIIDIPSVLKKDEILPQFKYASYKINLKNCGENVDIVSYVPNWESVYRIFIDGNLVSSSGIISKVSKEVKITHNVNKRNLNISQVKDCTLIIETSNPYFYGMTLTPILIDSNYDYIHSNLRVIWASIYIGIILIVIINYAIMLFLKNHSFHSKYLILFYILIFIKILAKGEIFSIINMFNPIINYHMLSFLLYFSTFWAPLYFIMGIKEVFKLDINQLEIRVLKFFSFIIFITSFISLLPLFNYIRYFVHILTFLLFLFVLLTLYTKGITKGKPYSLSLSIGYIFIVFGIVIDSLYVSGTFIFNLSMYLPTCYIFFIIIMHYIYAKNNLDLQKDALEVAELRLKVKESETTLMLSQIRPHFLYNALIAIQVLCTREPETAEKAVIQFAKYLRANMNSIDSKTPINFEDELNHIKNYVEIEKLRFKERLNVIFDISSKDFRVPSLTIQPLVENAIKHGVCKRVKGGTVIIKTYEDKTFYFVKVSDNGVGFDTNILNNTNSDSLGIKNIKLRLEFLINADIDIKSCKNNGTEVVVKIPKEVKFDERYISR